MLSLKNIHDGQLSYQDDIEINFLLNIKITQINYVCICLYIIKRCCAVTLFQRIITTKKRYVHNVFISLTLAHVFEISNKVHALVMEREVLRQIEVNFSLFSYYIFSSITLVTSTCQRMNS